MIKRNGKVFETDEDLQIFLYATTGFNAQIDTWLQRLESVEITTAPESDGIINPSGVYTVVDDEEYQAYEDSKLTGLEGRRECFNLVVTSRNHRWNDWIALKYRLNLF